MIKKHKYNYIVQCVVCDTVFKAKNRNRRTCSNLCRMRLYYLRHNPKTTLIWYKKMKEYEKIIQKVTTQEEEKKHDR